MHFILFYMLKKLVIFQSESFNDATFAIYSINLRKSVYAIFTVQRVTLGS